MNKFERVLSNEDLLGVYRSIDIVRLSRAIAQDVLQLPEIQALRKDAARYRYMKKGRGWIVAATQTGWHVDGEELDELIDNEMEKQQ